MNLKIPFSDIKLNFGIFFFSLILVFPVNILIIIDNQITLEFATKFDYVYQNLNNDYKFFAGFPLSFLLVPIFIYSFFLNFLRGKIFYGHKTIFLIIYLFVSLFVISIFYFNDVGSRILKNFFSANLLIFFIFYSKIFINNYSMEIIKKVIFFSTLIVSYICLNNLFVRKLFYDDEFSGISSSNFLFNMQISHYYDYFPYLILILIGIIFFSKNNLFSFKEKFYYITIFTIWLLDQIIIQNKGMLIVVIFYLITSTLFALKILRKTLIKYIYFFYLPLILIIFFSISLAIYGVESSLDERFRTFIRNYDNLKNILFPLIDQGNLLVNYSNIHNDFLDLYTLYGIFSFFIFNLIMLRIRKIMSSNFFYGYFWANIFFLGSLVQNNFLNPYLLILFSLILGLKTKDYFKSI